MGGIGSESVMQPLDPWDRLPIRPTARATVAAREALFALHTGSGLLDRFTDLGTAAFDNDGTFLLLP